MNVSSIAVRKSRGRPRNAERYDESREYTVGTSSSYLSRVDGAKDLQRLHGSVDDIDIRLGWDAKRQMRNDPVVDSAIKTRALGATARPMEVVPAAKSEFLAEGDEKKADDVAAFIRRDMRRIKSLQRDIGLTAFAVLDEALGTGHAKAEISTELIRSGVDELKRGVTKIKLKNRYNSCFVVDRHNNIVGIAGYTGNYNNYGNPYLQATVQSYGLMPYSQLSGSGWELLPRDKWLIVTNQAPDDDSPLGRSLLRSAYTAYRNKRDAWVMWLKALDNTAMGMDVVILPQGAGDTWPLVNGVPDKSAQKVPMATATLQGLLYARQAGALVLPNGSTHQRIHSSASGDPFASIFSFCDSQIAISILMQTLATGEGKHMARAAGQIHQDILDLAMRHDRRLIADCITRDIFEPLVRKNFTPDYWHLVPDASFGQVDLQDFAAWAEAFAKLAREGLLLPSQFPHIWDILGLPQGDLDELIHQLSNDEAVIQAIMAAQVNPTTGTTEPSQAAKYIPQEAGKNMTRCMGQRISSRMGATL